MTSSQHSSPSTPIAPKLLQEHLRRGAAARESKLARFISIGTACCIGSTLGFAPVLGWPHVLSLCAVLASLSLYYAWVHLRLKHVEPSPALIWLNVALENSLVGCLFLLDITFNGPAFAMTSPVGVIAGAAIVASAMRSDTRLPMFAAAVASLELVLLYACLVYPRLPQPVPLLLSPMFIFQRAVYYFVTGWLAQLVAGQFRSMAEEALRAVRQQELLGRYFLHERLGSGGMAEVFRATYSPEGGIEKTVALKRILPAYAEDPQFLALFRREAELGAILQHPNVVQVLDVGRLDNTHFISMEYVDGLSLRKLLKAHGPLPLSAVTYLGAELASALDYVHRRTSRDGVLLNLVHRDVNPPNILLSRIGDVKLSDFGIARAVTHASVTQLGSVRGKAHYMALEQLQGGPLDGRTDLFALGLTLHEALTGRRVLRELPDTPGAFLNELKNLAPPSALRPEVPAELDRVIMSLLRPRPEDRPQRGSHLEELLRAMPGPAAPYPQGPLALAQAIRDVLTPKTGTLPAQPFQAPSPPPDEDVPTLEATARLRPGR
jgi:hypothetical protein